MMRSGEPARAALQEAAASSEEAEIRLRASRLLPALNAKTANPLL